MVLALALSFVNMGMRALVVRADTLQRLLERLKDRRPNHNPNPKPNPNPNPNPIPFLRLPEWMRPPEAAGDPHARQTSPWDLIVTGAHLVLRVGYG